MYVCESARVFICVCMCVYTRVCLCAGTESWIYIVQVIFREEPHCGLIFGT